MTAVLTRVPCPVDGCGYTMDSEGSVAAHVAMAHPQAAPAPKKRSARNGHTVEASAANPPVAEALPTAELREIPLDLVDVGANVRISIEDLEELAASIAEHGVLQPVKVTPVAGDRYLLVWGQRRTLAARQAGLTTIPAIVDDTPAGGAQRSVEQLVENLHRADLPALDRARAIRDVVATGMSQADLARKLGIAPSTVANDLGLLEAPAPIQQLLERGELTPAHAKAMKGLAPKTQIEVAKMAVEHGFSAHRTEQEVQNRKRRADLDREHEQQQAKAREAKRASAEASIAEFAKKKVAKDDLIIVDSGYSYGDSGSSGHVVKLILAAGYTNVRAAKSWNEIQASPGAVLCDCVAWKVAEHTTYSYATGGSVEKYRISITKGCTDATHQRAKESVADQKRRAKEAVGERVQQHVRRTASAWAIPEGRAIAIDRILAESALWSLLSYRIPEWALSHGGSKKNPFAAIHALSDEDLAKELAVELAKDFRDKAGYHVDWQALADEIEAAS